MSKIQFWKQFTTDDTATVGCDKLLLICQRYNFESNSQPISFVVFAGNSCYWYVKDTILKAIHNLNYQHTLIENEYKNIDNEKAIILTITRTFKTNTEYTAKEVKNKLQDVYNALELNKKAKATDLITLVGATKKVAKINYKSVDIYTIPKFNLS